ncbi:hypothetical protein HMPREF9374_2266 [Desmospora sp. 8437]|nr:hypothetical protein HMPREF9374_2266 [Desmospora sp. 8437]
MKSRLNAGEKAHPATQDGLPGCFILDTTIDKTCSWIHLSKLCHREFLLRQVASYAI